MTQVRLDEDEAWPTYYLRDDDRFGVLVTLPDEQVAHWQRVRAEWRQVQDEMAAVYEAAKPPDPPKPRGSWGGL